MRLGKKFTVENEEHPLEGCLLLAHPSLSDGCFDRAVVWIMVHSAKEGALGLIVNRPLQMKLGEYDADLDDSELSSIPLFYGGPVNDRQVTLVAWKQMDEVGVLKFHFGIDKSEAREIISSDQGFEICGFVGYSGWAQGQLEGELKTDSWVLTELTAKLSEMGRPNTWKTLLASKNPLMGLLVNEPEDLSLN